MAFENWFAVNMKGNIFGVPTNYFIRGFSETLQPDPQAIDVYQQVYDQWWLAIKPLVSESYMCYSIKIEVGTIGSIVFTTYEGYVNETGQVSVSDSQPSWLCVNFVKYPDNGVIEATYPDPTPFKNGRVGIAGVPEVDVEGNFLTDTALPIWEAAAQSWLMISEAFGTGTPNLYSGMQRFAYAGDPPVNVGSAYTTLSNMHVAQKLGSRVGRKP